MNTCETCEWGEKWKTGKTYICKNIESPTYDMNLSRDFGCIYHKEKQEVTIQEAMFTIATWIPDDTPRLKQVKELCLKALEEMNERENATWKALYRNGERK